LGRSNVFDLLGPIMVGPSSSHTAGAVRLGLMARKILNGNLRHAKMILHGSFAKTGKGHGTPLALTAGLLGMKPDDERIREAINLAKEQGIDVEFIEGDLGEVHANTVKFELEDDSGHQVVIVGSSVGGGRIIVRQVNAFEVEIMGDYPTLIVLQRDLPGVVAHVAKVLAEAGINIAQMKVAREKKGAFALMVLETDEPLAQTILTQLLELSAIQDVMILDPLE